MNCISRVVAVGAILSLPEAPAVPGPGGGAVGPSVVSVKDYGAKADGKTPDTDAIQRAVDAVRPGGTVRFPPGNYLIETNKGVRLKGNIRLDLETATLLGPNVKGARCRIFEIQGAKGITIYGGTLVGSALGAPEWGVGLLASDAEDVLLQNVWFRDFYHDGILLTGNKGCKRVTVRRCVAVNNRRTGLAVVHASDVTVEDSTFNGTRGQSPQAGMNCEPNPGQEVRRVRIRRSWFRGNAGTGLYVHRAQGKAVADVSVENSMVEDNDTGIVMSQVDGIYVAANRVLRHAARNKSGIALGEVTRAKVMANALDGNARGILSSGSTAVDIRDNTIVGTGPATTANGGDSQDGILCLGGKAVLANACVVANNTIRRAAGSGIVTDLVSGIQVLNNTIQDPGQRGTLLRGTALSQVRGNKISGTGSEPPPRRYDAIEVERASHNNQIISNTIHRSAGMRNPIGVAPGCLGNYVANNVIK